MYMNILIPAAGLGTRFKDHYDNPKNIIDVKGEPMLVASARSLKLSTPENTFIFVIPENEYTVELKERLEVEFPGCRVLNMAGESQGAAETAVSAQGFFPDDEELLIANCDQIMAWSDEARDRVFTKLREFDAGIVTIKSDDPKHSYLNLETGEIVEKEVVSDQALVGLHYWKQSKDFINSTRLMMQSGKRSKGEYYIGPTYNWFGGSAGYYEIEENEIHFIGTPEDLQAYLEK
jgi:dTDP-glucose pyrophosphorylase